MLTAKRLRIFAGLLTLVVYATFLLRNLSYSVGGPDTSGYMNEAKMIAAGHMTLPVDLVHTLKLDDSWLYAFMPYGFAPSPGGRMHPTYPPGLPMHLAVAGLIGGWRHAPFFLMPLAATGVLALLFAIARKLELPFSLSVAAPAILGFFAPFLWHAVQPASDVLATFWTLAAIYCCLEAFDRPWMATLAGASFAISVWVRPTNILLVFACILAMRCRPKLLLRAAIAALPFAFALMWWNTLQYGSAFRTGYGGVLESLSWQGAAYAGPEYIRSLATMLTPVVFPVGLAVVFDHRAGSWTRWMLIVWFVPFFVFYCFYGFWNGWVCLRFLLPAIPALILGALVMIRDAVDHLRNTAASAVGAALVIWLCSVPLRFSRKDGVIDVLPHLEEGYPHAVHWAERQLPPQSIVVTGVLSGAFLNYAHRSIARYDQLNDDQFQLLRAYAGNAGLRWYAVVGDDEIDQARLEKRLKGKWTAIGHLETVTLYRLDS